MQGRWPFRVTDPLLDLLDALVGAHGELHGWELIKQTGRSGATVYQTLDRLRSAGWVSCRWEILGPEENRPRRRFYLFTAEGARLAPALLAERRPVRARQQVPGLVWFPGVGIARADGAA
jgi:PadR family transcriptional regulator